MTDTPNPPEFVIYHETPATTLVLKRKPAIGDEPDVRYEPYMRASSYRKACDLIERLARS